MRKSCGGVVVGVCGSGGRDSAGDCANAMLVTLCHKLMATVVALDGVFLVVWWMSRDRCRGNVVGARCGAWCGAGGDGSYGSSSSDDARGRR